MITPATKTAAKKCGISIEDYVMLKESGLKRCTKCKRWLPINNFGIDSGRADGIRTACYDCRRVKTKRQHINQAPNKLAQGRATHAIRKAIERGTMVKAKMLTCRHCHKQATEYHHHLGYDEVHWLDVIPLCNGCHKKSHFE